MPSVAKDLASVPPPRQYGTTTPVGSSARSASAIAVNHGESTGADTGNAGVVTNSRRTPGPASSSMTASTSSATPGNTRTSTSASARDGTTFTADPADSAVSWELHRTVAAASPAAPPSRTTVASPA